MPCKCCVPQCKSNYFSEEKKENEKVFFHQFPLNKEERKK